MSQLQKGSKGCATRPAAGVVYFLFFSILANVSLSELASSISPFQTQTENQSPISKGKDPAEIIGIVLAMSREPMDEIPYYSAEILLLKVERLAGGRNPGPFLRADFANYSVTADSKEARVFRELDQSLREGKTWKIRLRPPRGASECAWKIPPLQKSGELAVFRTPIIVPVAGASGYPDINSLPCYVFEQKDIGEVLSPDNRK